MRSARSLLPAVVLLAAGLFVLQHAPFAGLHLDDHAFHRSLSAASREELRREFLFYVPGRNLYILYYAALYRILGSDPLRLHLFGVALDLLNVLLAYAFLRRLSAPRSWALAAAGLFLVWPNHNETHFWTSAIAMNLLSTTFLLLAFLAAGIGRLPPAARLALSGAAFVLALFDYDQAFFMWVPILFYAGWLAPAPRPSKALLSGAAAGFLSLNLAHVLLRAYAPHSHGGRPVIRLGQLPVSFVNSFYESLVPLRKLPLWDSLDSVAGGPWATLASLALLAGCWSGAVAWLRRREREGNEALPRAVGLAALGALWFVCAYAPNYFWYISPRHNYLPSLGMLMVLVPFLLVSPARGRLLAPLGGTVFFLGSASILAEGAGWRRAADLHEAFRSRAPSLAPAPAALFLAGAPLDLDRAPAFRHPHEHLYLFSQAAGGLPRSGSRDFCAGRSGVFHGSEIDLFGRGSLYYEPYASMTLLSLRGDKLERAGSLALSLPGGERRSVDLGGWPGQAALEAPVWLAASARERARGEPIWTAPNGAALLSAKASEPEPRVLAVELLWRAPRAPRADFAAVLTLTDPAGRVVFDPAYAIESNGARGHRLLCPAFNDLDPPGRRPQDSATRESYRMTLPSPLPPGPLTLRLALFEARPTAWAPAGEGRVPIERP